MPLITLAPRSKEKLNKTYYHMQTFERLNIRVSAVCSQDLSSSIDCKSNKTDSMSSLGNDVVYLIENLSDYVIFNAPLKNALTAIAFNPIFWNLVARTEYKTHVLTKVAGSAKTGCYLLAFTIFTLGLFRDHIYQGALESQPVFKPFAESQFIKGLAIFLFGFGNVLVLTSMYALGITGTYLGDYFGILMDDRVTGFPFNITDNPMYNGSAMCFLGTALWYAKPAGILVSAFVFVMYKIALIFEEPFTARIYAEREEERKKKEL